MIFGGRLRLHLHDAFLVLRTCHATAAERERALSSFRACGVLEKAEQRHLFDLYEIVTGCRPRYPSDSTTSLRERVLKAARDSEILVIPGWEESDTPIDKIPARPEAKVAQQVMAREKELAFEGASYVVLPATSWKELSCGAGRSFEVVRREVAKATLLRMSTQAATSDRKRALAEAAELVADGNVAFGGLFLARRRIERTFVVADETPVLTPSQMRRALMSATKSSDGSTASRSAEDASSHCIAPTRVDARSAALATRPFAESAMEASSAGRAMNRIAQNNASSANFDNPTALVAQWSKPRGTMSAPNVAPSATPEPTASQPMQMAKQGGPTEPYNRSRHYGKTPTAADRKAVGAGSDEVADHHPPLVKRFYEGDSATGEKPGYQMSTAERKASAKDRSRMRPQPKAESNAQGGKMSRYSKEKKEEHDL